MLVPKTLKPLQLLFPGTVLRLQFILSFPWRLLMMKLCLLDYFMLFVCIPAGVIVSRFSLVSVQSVECSTSSGSK